MAPDNGREGKQYFETSKMPTKTMKEQKLLCIIDGPWVQRKRLFWGLIKFWQPCDGPCYGDTVTKTGECWEDGELYYHLKEWPQKDENDGYLAECFIPIQEEEESAEEVAVHKFTNKFSKQMKSTIITAILLSVMISGYGQFRYVNENEKPDRRDYVSTGCMMDPGFDPQTCGRQEKSFRTALAKWEEAEKNKPKRPPAPSLEKLSARMDSFFETLEQLQADQIQSGMNDYNAMIGRTNLLGESLAVTRERVDSLSHELESQRKLLQFNTDMGNYYIRKVDSLRSTQATPYLALGSVDYCDTAKGTLQFSIFNLSPFVLQIDTCEIWTGRVLGEWKDTTFSPKAYITQEHPLTLRVDLTPYAVYRYQYVALAVEAYIIYLNPATGRKRLYHFSIDLSPDMVNKIKKVYINENIDWSKP